jgi:hypothetical protein
MVLRRKSFLETGIAHPGMQDVSRRKAEHCPNHSCLIEQRA